MIFLKYLKYLEKEEYINIILRYSTKKKIFYNLKRNLFMFVNEPIV